LTSAVPELVLPTPRVRRSFLDAMAEFSAEGRGGPPDYTMVGRELRHFGPTWQTPEGFAAYVESMLAESREETPRPDGFVPSTTWWWVEGDEYLGRIAVRHRLTNWLREVGGHIGYDVRPSARRQGHATAMLRAVMPLAAGLGVNPALVTCDVDNIASRRVIEANKGELEDERNGKLRFWVPAPE
jgi:predicted acetyltransferase